MINTNTITIFRSETIKKYKLRHKLLTATTKHIQFTYATANMRLHGEISYIILLKCYVYTLFKMKHGCT